MHDSTRRKPHAHHARAEEYTQGAPFFQDVPAGEIDAGNGELDTEHETGEVERNGVNVTLAFVFCDAFVSAEGVFPGTDYVEA